MTRKGVDIGPLSPNGRGRHYTPLALTFPAPTKHCNAAMRDPLPATGSAPARPGAEQHRQYRSRGLGC